MSKDCVGPISGQEEPSASRVSEQVLDRFLSDVEADAYRLSLAATRNQDEAVDLVQDVMLTMVQKYRHKPEDELAPLFHRVLQNRIRDWYRRRSTRHALLRWTGLGDTTSAVEAIESPESLQPEQLLNTDGELKRIEQAIQRLPVRQQQTFLLRAWKEMSVEETTAAMSLSAGSVKTHYSRAVASLREILGEN